jgi:hypothetical protein
MPTYFKDYGTRWSENKDVFIYGALTGAIIYWATLKYITKKM